MDINNILLDESASRVMRRIEKEEDNTFMSLPPPISETDGSTANITQDSSVPTGPVPEPFPPVLTTAASSPAIITTSTPAFHSTPAPVAPSSPIDISPPSTVSTTTNQTTIKAPPLPPSQHSFKLRMRTQQQPPPPPVARMGRGLTPRTPLAVRSPNIKTPPQKDAPFTTPKPKAVEFSTPKPSEDTALNQRKQHLLSALQSTIPRGRLYHHQTPNPSKVKTPHPLARAILAETTETTENTVDSDMSSHIVHESNDTVSSNEEVELRQADTSLPLNGTNGVTNARLNQYLNKLNQGLSEENQELAAQNDEALANVARLEGENNELRSQKDEAVADLERVENNNNELRSQREEAMATAERLDSECDMFKGRLEEREHECDILKQRVEEHESESDMLKQRLEENEHENEMLRNRLEQQERELRVQHQNLEEERREHQQTKEEYHALQRNANNLNSIVNSPNPASEYSVNKSVRFQSNIGIRTPKTPGQFNLTKMSSIGDTTISPLYDEIKILKQKIDELQEDRNEENKESHRILQENLLRIQSQEKESERLRGQAQGYEKECEMLRERLEEYENDLEVLREQLVEEQQQQNNNYRTTTDSPISSNEYSVNKSVRFQPHMGIRTPKTPGQFNITKATTAGDMTISPLYDEINALKQKIDELEEQRDDENKKSFKIIQEKAKLEATLNDVPYLKKALTEVKKHAADLGEDMKSLLERKDAKDTHYQHVLTLHTMWIEYLNYRHLRQNRFIVDLRAQKQYYSKLVTIFRDELISIQDQLHRMGHNDFNFFPDVMPHPRYEVRRRPPTLRAVALAVRFACVARSYYFEARENTQYKERIRREYENHTLTN